MAPSDASRRNVKKASKMSNPVEKLQCLPAHEDRKTVDGYSMSQWGWDPESKKAELSATTARFIIAKNEKGEPIGYTHYRFDMDHNTSVLYCYEIQVEERYQKKGVGTLLIQTLETLAEKTGMEKVMATVFAFNEKSLGFFHKLGYETDISCPDENQGRDYLILSKAVV
ncbi:acetyltransferase, GNAT family [Teladorsagia circumcincta]|uniref:N-alpha-acetyltransferase 40 n=1 Tax=Teladorsagia circumcincta TaxID=45464 RepID=A0A2G9UV28_TELCI|nr:acetyltransferase, GNAT family [Teladorsagia circumcincta]